MTKDRILKTVFGELLMGGTGLLFLLLFSYMTSPVFPYSYGWDSAFFQLVGAGMTRGYLPYRDFFDMKGPWLFLIQYAGQLLIYGKTGIFLIQYVSLWSTLFLCRRIFKVYFNERRLWCQFLCLIPLCLILAPTMEGGNLTEEWSLPFLFLALYWALPFLLKKQKTHSPYRAFGYGCCFGVLMLIRITNSVLICAIILTVACALIRERQWKNFAFHVIAFLAGILAAFVPPLLYFGRFGEIKDMLYCTFVFGFQYGTEGFALGTGRLFLITLFLPVFLFCICHVKNSRLWLLIILYTGGMCVTLGMGNSTLHDYMLILPGVMLGIWQAADAVHKGQLGERNVSDRRRLLAGMVLFTCLLYPCYKTIGSCQEIIRQASERSVYDHVMETAALIPVEERECVWGYGVPLRWYIIADIMPYNKYCGWQDHYMKLSPAIEEEIMGMLRDAPPKWVVTKAPLEIENEGVNKELKEKYKVACENEDFILFCKIQNDSERE